MANIEILPQSVADIKTLIFKSRLDPSALETIYNKTKVDLFSKLTMKPKPEDIQLISSENYYEPYLFIAGKYTLDYCRENSLIFDVNKEVNKVYMAGQEFYPTPINLKTNKKTVKLTVEEYKHLEEETFFVLDRAMVEVSPEKISFSPFDSVDENCPLNSDFRKMEISMEQQINCLKSRIVLRPANLEAIVKEVFEITHRIIVYVPMYQFTFENQKNQKRGEITLNGITGEKKLIRFKKENHLSKKPRSTEEPPSPTSASNPIADNRPVEGEICQTIQEQEIVAHSIPSITADFEGVQDIEAEGISEVVPCNITDSDVLGFPAVTSGEVFSVGDNVVAVVGDLTIPSGTNVNKTLVVKGTLKIGENCKVNGRLKVLNDIFIGADTIVNANIASGGNVFLGSRSTIKGSIEATGSIRVDQDAVIENEKCLNDSATNDSKELQIIVDTGQEIASVVR